MKYETLEELQEVQRRQNIKNEKIKSLVSKLKQEHLGYLTDLFISLSEDDGNYKTIYESLEDIVDDSEEED